MIGSISIPDVNRALLQALPKLLDHGQRHTADSVANARPTVEWPGIFLTEYTRPNRNVLFDPIRDANPIFHYLEAMWILAGRNDVAFMQYILPRYVDYSDDGKVLHGAYGYRLRHWFGDEDEIDQIEESIEILKASPNSRQVVMSIWDPALDLGTKTKDMPCNDMIMLKVREGRLNMTVCNRSNDAIWGCYGANAVQFSMIQMYIAARLGVGLGVYVQQSDSFHVYDDNPYWQTFLKRWHEDREAFAQEVEKYNHLYSDELGDANLFAKNPELVLPELKDFFLQCEMSIETGQPYAHPLDTGAYSTSAAHDAACLFNALTAHRAKQYDEARAYVDGMWASDWRCGVNLWLSRRGAK